MAGAREGGARLGWRGPASQALAGRPAGAPFLSLDQMGGGVVRCLSLLLCQKRQDQTSPPLPPCGLSPVFQMEMVNSFRIFIHVFVYPCLDYKSSWVGGRAGVQGVGLGKSPHLPPSFSEPFPRLLFEQGLGEPNRLPPAPPSWSPTPAPAGWPGSWPGPQEAGRQNQNGLLWPDDTSEHVSCPGVGAILPSPKASSPSSSSIRVGASGFSFPSPPARPCPAPSP